MECPKCGGGCLLSEEELVKILEATKAAEDMIRAVIKASYICRACSERFSRLFVDDLAKRKRPEDTRPSYTPIQTSEEAPVQQEGTDPAEGLKFF